MTEISLKTNRTRAEQVRARRQQTSHVRQGYASQAARQPARKTPPVVSRRTTPAAAPSYKRVSSQTRRSFSVSMDSGAELVLGSLPNIQVGWRSVSGFLTVILVILVLFFTNSSMFRVTSPELVGISSINVSDISAILNLGNKPIFAIDPRVVSAQVTQSFPQLKNVRVTVGFPASVVIKAEERLPVLAWEYNGPVVWIDSEGYIFEASESITGLPVVHADELPLFQEISEPAEDDTLVAVSPLAPTIRKMDLGQLQAAITISANVPAGSDLVYSPLEGFGWFDPGGWKVFIGTDLSNLELKLLMYHAITQTLSERGITPTMISVAQPDAPFYRVE